ncbi:hypothetical protein OXX69_007948 [Metschnikowia pulcherrima]
MSQITSTHSPPYVNLILSSSATQKVLNINKQLVAMHLKPLGKLTLLFLAVKTVQFAVIIYTPAQFDVSSALLLQNYVHEKAILSTFHTPIPLFNSVLKKSAYFVLDRIVDRLVSWDAVYFADLFANGIQYEHQYVFCPLWWRLIRAISGNRNTNFYSCLLNAVFITNLCHLAASMVLYFYTLEVFGKARIFSPSRMAMATSILYVCSPAAAYLTAPYSEAIAALCSFLCLYLREVSVGRDQHIVTSLLKSKNGQAVRTFENDDVSDHALEDEDETKSKHAPLANISTCLYILSGAFAALAFGFRANCLFLGLIYVYDICCKKTRSPFLPLAAGSILGIAFLALQLHSYFSVCPSGRGEWCDSKFPSLFAYAQSHYWGNGFFKYWTTNNVANFLFAAPTIALSGYSVRYFGQTYPVERVLPVSAVNMVFLTSLLLLWHVQIITRIHTFLPVVYWLVAGLITQPNARHQRWARVVVTYFVGWNVLQTALFAAFLPPA